MVYNRKAKHDPKVDQYLAIIKASNIRHIISAHLNGLDSVPVGFSFADILKITVNL